MALTNGTSGAQPTPCEDLLSALYERKERAMTGHTHTDRFETPQIVEHIPGAAMRLVPTGSGWKTAFVTRNFASYGYDLNEFISGTRNWLDLVHPDDRSHVFSTLRSNTMQGIHESTFNFRLITSAGKHLPVTAHMTLSKDDKGVVRCLDIVILDSANEQFSTHMLEVHHQQLLVLNDIFMNLYQGDTEEEVNLILERTGRYLDASRVVLFRCNHEQGCCTVEYEWCNDGVLSIAQCESAQSSPAILPEYLQAVRENGYMLLSSESVSKAGRARFLAEKLVSSAHFALSTRDSLYGILRFDDCTLTRAWDADTRRFLHNITNLVSVALSRKVADTMLEQNRKVYEAVLDNIDSYIFAVNTKNNEVVFANLAFKKSFGQDCIGIDADELLPGIAFLTYNAQLHPEMERSYPEIFSHQTGEWLAVCTERIPWVDGSTVFLNTCYDVTEKRLFADKLAQKVEERTRELTVLKQQDMEINRTFEAAAVEAKSSFLASFSHELRTPLNAILGLSEILSRTQLDTTSLEHVANIQRSSTILVRIMNDVMDIFASEAGKLKLKKKHFQMRKTLERMATHFNNMARSKGIVFTLDLPENLPEYTFGDESRLHQILHNLVHNAVKFTERGTVGLSVDVHGETIVFEVADTGMGIKPEEMGIIFDSFARTSNIRYVSIQGAGLGLPLCKNLVKLMGGTIEAHSSMGIGSRFTVTLPNEPGDAAFFEFDSMENCKFTAPTVTVLVVDDLEVNLYVLKAMLDEFRINSVLCLSGNEALETLYQRDDFDLILMDQVMPGLSGVETIAAIKQMSEKLAAIPVVVVTANVSPDSPALAENARVDEILAKPLEPQKLKAALQKWLPAHKLVFESTDFSLMSDAPK